MFSLLFINISVKFLGSVKSKLNQYFEYLIIKLFNLTVNLATTILRSDQHSLGIVRIFDLR